MMSPMFAESPGLETGHEIGPEIDLEVGLEIGLEASLLLGLEAGLSLGLKAGLSLGLEASLSEGLFVFFLNQACAASIGLKATLKISLVFCHESI